MVPRPELCVDRDRRPDPASTHHCGSNCGSAQLTAELQSAVTAKIDFETDYCAMSLSTPLALVYSGPVYSLYLACTPRSMAALPRPVSRQELTLLSEWTRTHHLTQTSRRKRKGQQRRGYRRNMSQGITARHTREPGAGPCSFLFGVRSENVWHHVPATLRVTSYILGIPCGLAGGSIA